MNPSRYPYVVIRLMACVTMEKPVTFTTSETPRLEVNHSHFKVFYPENPFSDDGKLKDGALLALKAAVRDFMSRERFRCCLVLSKKRSIFLEANGVEKESKRAPSGGITLATLEPASPKRAS